MQNFDYMVWVVIPLLIFLARLADVSLATLRHILIFRGLKKIVPLFAFVEVVIWLLAISQVMNNLNNIACFLAFAFGFSAGTYVGMVIEERLALGYQLVRIIAQGNASEIARMLSDAGYGITTVDANGSRGAVGVVIAVSERKRLPKLVALLGKLDPSPFYTVEDVRSVGRPIGPPNVLPGELSLEGSVKRK
ncbi:DUF2179 domain-containing protein [Pelagicoccus sp. SDUM812005]|uniref:DUF2179 domain-containing protein n=1 Tax=Pelagicoccus sp. SDUM812005 TaxID=3041257 RepID=UPI00280DB8AB|nr:DUF2179 domain-containing protein [Pelagicoccus sp. SDUM812005]MDQ8182235.1 DUF2179 domain-containing protein [Pelagicoccus sp. SDUM812005]